MWPTRGGRRNGDDAAGPARLHARQKAFDGEERRREIGIDRCTPRFFISGFDRPRERQVCPGIRDENVHWAETTLDFSAHPFDVGKTRHVTGNADRFATCSID